jgi:hypothetical protein
MDAHLPALDQKLKQGFRLAGRLTSGDGDAATGVPVVTHILFNNAANLFDRHFLSGNGSRLSQTFLYTGAAPGTGLAIKG